MLGSVTGGGGGGPLVLGADGLRACMVWGLGLLGILGVRFWGLGLQTSALKSIKK